MYYFNPRSHEGSDGLKHVGCILEKNFNPRSHEGSDRSYRVNRIKSPYFNPRSHEGSDWEPVLLFWTKTKFQSTLPRGERRDLYPTILQVFQFQSTLPRGERHIPIQPLADIVNFNPRSHEGSDSNFRQKVLFSLSKNCLKYLILTTNYFN